MCVYKLTIVTKLRLADIINVSKKLNPNWLNKGKIQVSKTTYNFFFNIETSFFFCICVGYGLQTCNIQLREFLNAIIGTTTPSGHTIQF